MSTDATPLSGQNPVQPPVMTATTPVAASTQRSSFLLFHGFFFMEFQNQDKELVVASPSLRQHEFRIRDQGKGVQSWDGRIDPAALKLKPASTKPSFPPEMLKFSRNAAKITGSANFISSTSEAQCTCAAHLPVPKSIIPLRLGPMSDFHAVNGNVAASIRTLTSGSRVALIIALEYDCDVPFTRSYFAQHAMPHLENPNEALTRARAVFGNDFDLAVTLDPTAMTVSPDDPGSLPNGITPDDEDELFELARHKATVTMPLGRSLVMREQRIVSIQSLQVATCPLFGVVS